MWSLCEHGYLYDFMFTSRALGMQELELENDLTPTTSMVYQLAMRIPKAPWP